MSTQQVLTIEVPKEINYAQGLPSLPPNTVNTSIVIAPTQSGTITQGSIVQFDLPSSGFADPGTFYLRYKVNITNGATVTSWLGTPAVAPIAKLEVLIGSTPFQTINNYNMVYNMVTNLQMNVAQKFGCSNLGYLDSTAATLNNVNGGYIASAAGSTSTSYSFPLMSVLSSAEQLLPLFLMPGVRVQLTIANLSDIVANTTTLTNFSLSNMELCYDSINFGMEIDNAVKSMGDVLFIKSCGWGTTSQTLGGSLSGGVNLVYNTRYQSMRSLFANFASNNSSVGINKNFDSFDITSNNGDYQFLVNGIGYPTRPVSTALNKYGALMELKMAINGGLHTLQAQNMSISPAEFGRIDNVASTVIAPAKFWFGVNTEKLSTSGSLLTGISTRDMPISLNVNIGTPTNAASIYNVSLITLYDALFRIDVLNRNATIVL